MAVRNIQHWRDQLHEIIFESNTRAGKAFDVVLLVFIFTSVLVVMLDSVSSLHQRFGQVFYALEWIFTILFTVEYLLRLATVARPALYASSPLGIIDLLSILPTYLSLMISGTQALMVLRALRLLRVFRIFNMHQFLGEARFLRQAIYASLKKISIFMLAVCAIVIILGSVMYLVEQGQNGFNSIPDSIYWAIVTITTVGYGDISPITPLGKFVASIIMLIGYGIIAVPTGIVTSEMSRSVRQRKESSRVCTSCGREGHDLDARFCKFCGQEL